MDVTPRSESQLNPSSHGKCIIGLFPTHLSRLDRVHREIPCRNRVPRRLVSILAPLGLPHTVIATQMLHASDRASQLFVQDENGRVRPVFLRESSQTLTHALLQYPLYIDLCEALPHDIARIRGLRGKATDYEDIISHPQAIQL
ncbi:hypothetical protein CA14_012843 [Aspergillus flavus]|uniref:Uncharacterized protein n=1 Tax=Aspergillus flavus TaxID=5059 RepID=A0AB74CAU4_ASPFL|nr:hypothetical protein CA14_012843 [Aspergillus flavus]